MGVALCSGRAAIVWLSVALISRTAHADNSNYFTETHFDLGVQSLQDVSFGGGAGSGMGLHLTEHNGVVARMIAAIPFLFMILQAGGDKKISSTVTEEDITVDHVSHGQTQYRTTERAQVWRWGITERSDSEKAAQQQLRDGIARMATGALQYPMHFELLYLPDRDDEHLHGVRGAFYPIAVGIGRHVEIAVGYSGARLKVDVTDPDSGMKQTLLHRSRAIPVRLGVAPTRWLVLTAELHFNILGQTHDDMRADYGSTVRAIAAISIPRVERLYAKLGAEKIGLDGGNRWSTFFEGGVRF